MGGMRGEKYVFNEEVFNDIICSDPPCSDPVYHTFTQGAADELHRLFKTPDSFPLESLELQLLI